MITNIQYSENSINASKFITDFVKCHARNIITNHITWAKAWGNQICCELGL